VLGRILPEAAINFFSQYFPPVYISHITGIVSQATGNPVEGWFIACPLTPKQMVTLPPEKVYQKVIQTGKLAEKLGARILGLGGFTAVIGDGGLTVSKQLNIPVTTGDSYTIATAVEGTLKAARRMGIHPRRGVAAVVGATGSIGRVCAQLLGPQVAEIILVGHRPEELAQVKALVLAQGQLNTRISTTMLDLRQADIVLTVTNTIDAVIEPQHLKIGAVVCDVARPRDVSRQVLEERDDVLVIEGGMVRVPGAVNFNFDFGFPPGMAFACMAETMALALEGRYESYTVGKNIGLEQVQTMADIASRHGFQVNGFRSFELAVTDETITQIKKNVLEKQAQLNWANP
jgi:predicted amino acid dehydrogenase